MKTKMCPKCKHEFAARGGNYDKHERACSGVYQPFVKLSSCKYCSLNFEHLTTSQRANHSRWCVDNPKRQDYIDSARDISQMNTPEALAKASAAIKKAHARGAYSLAPQKGVKTKRDNGNHRHTEESKQKIREKALASSHRRLVRSIRPYTQIDGSVVMLDSSWEEALAIRLDDLGIKWFRPDLPIKYCGVDGRDHNYFPDFYLPDYDIFLDPKNPAAVKAQQEKLDVLMKMMDNLIIIENLEGCKKFTPTKAAEGSSPV